MAVTPYVVDLGIDANLGMELSTGFPLQQGLVAVTDAETGEGSPSWYTGLRVKDTIAFRLWNITGEASGNLEVISLSASFISPTNTAQLSSPLADVERNPICFSENLFKVDGPTDVKTSVYPLVHTVWLVGQDVNPLGKVFEITKQGRYLLRVAVEVIVPPLGLRRYLVDPEMIIGPDESPPIPQT